jgi:hypothetical protein
VLRCAAVQVVEQLRSWHKLGYDWGEMVVLFRMKRQASCETI